MKPNSLTTAAKISVAALVLLGMVGGSLIIAHGGYETSPRRGGSSVFVPAPQSFIIAAMMYGMSVLGMVALLRAWHQSRTTITVAIALYAFVAVIFVSALGRILVPGHTVASNLLTEKSSRVVLDVIEIHCHTSHAASQETPDN